jgi:hypothetical protein
MNAVFRRRDDIIVRRVADETLLVPIRGDLVKLDRVYVLNRVGEQIWQQLDGQQDLSAISAGLMARFGIQAPEAEADVLEFIGQLQAADLVLEVA